MDSGAGEDVMPSQLSYESYEEFENAVDSKDGFTEYFVGSDYLCQSFRTIDISTTGSIDDSGPTSVSMRISRGEYRDRLEVERLRLRSLHKDVKTRLVLFNLQFSHASFIKDLYGIEFLIEPCFFEACKMGSASYRGRPDVLDLGWGCCAKLIDRDFDHPLIRRGLAIILISLRVHLATEDVHFSMLPRNVFDEGSSTKKSLIANMMPSTGVNQTVLDLQRVYATIILNFPEAYLVEAHERPWKFLIPLLEMRINEFQASAFHNYSGFCTELKKGNQSSEYGQLWKNLRQSVVDANLSVMKLKEHDSRHYGGRMQQSSELQLLLQRFDDIYQIVSIMEQHMRDVLQLQVGQLSLLESRESINQSRIAVEESKRLKMLTILAFIFIPFSLATSIFGMNIQELNSTGHHVWVFVLTAFAIFLTALCIWAMLYQWNKLIHSPRSHDPHWEEQLECRKRVRWSRRMGLLFWLVFHGHLIWCWRSGIVFSLITNGRIGFTRTCTKGDENVRLCPAEVKLSRTEQNPWEKSRHSVELNPHSAHAPCSYILGHMDCPSSNAFSFAKNQ